MEDQLLVSLMCLRLGSMEKELSYHFGVDEATVSCILKKWFNFLYLCLGLLPTWPEWEAVEACLPETFGTTYPSTFIVIDATELTCEVPSSLALQSQTYSSYKSHTTLKDWVVLDQMVVSPTLASYSPDLLDIVSV